MSYMDKDLTDFLILLEKYDFVEDTLAPEVKENYRSICDPYEKFFLYRMLDPCIRRDHGMKDFIDENLVKEPVKYINNILTFWDKSVRLGMKDPDSASKLLQNIYRKLWAELTGKIIMLNSSGIASDTMTSVQDSLNEAMKKFAEENDLKQIYEKRKVICSRRGSLVLAANNENTHFYELLDKEYPNFKKFIGVYHTLGNYCPVPDGFNRPRSNGGKFDYWDLTLEKIYEWYLSYEKGWDEKARRKLIQEELLHNSEEGNPDNCIKWLYFFGEGEDGWKNFVNTLFFQDYVKDYKNGDYRPNPFWDGHDWKHCKPSVKVCDNFFKEVSERIQKRGRRLALELWKKGWRNLSCDI